MIDEIAEHCFLQSCCHDFHKEIISLRHSKKVDCKQGFKLLDAFTKIRHLTLREQDDLIENHLREFPTLWAIAIKIQMHYESKGDFIR